MASPARREKSNRHIACHQCRQRKVKCDGRQPYCKRCASGGVAWECSYSTSARQEQREKQLSSSSGSPPSPEESEIITIQDYPDQLTANDPLLESVSCDLPSDMFTSHVASSGLSTADLWCLQSDLGSDSIYSSYTNAIYSESHSDEIVSPSHMIYESSLTESAPFILESHLQDLSLSTLDMLLLTYFQCCQTVCPLFNNQVRMQSSLQGTSNDTVAVRCAMCALAATIIPQSSVWVMSDQCATVSLSRYSQNFYHAAQDALQQGGKTEISQAPSLRVLQATVLLGLYELHRADFGRAWVTASRAVWITQALQLHNLDSGHGSPTVIPADTEDARMALWATMGLTGFLSLGGRAMDSMSVAEISTWLPRPPVDQFLSNAGVTVRSVFQNAVLRTLGIEEGICAAKILFPRIVSHVKTVSQEEDAGCQPYSFWTNHHKLQHMVLHIFNCTAAESKAKLVLDIVLNAMLTVLHEALIRKMSTSTQLQYDKMEDAEEASLQHSLQIAKIVETDVISQDSWARIAVPWAVYVSLQSLQQRQKRKNLHYKAKQIDNLTNILDESAVEFTLPLINTFQAPDPDLLVDALVLDSVHSLRLILLDWSNDLPLADFLFTQAHIETEGHGYAPDECVVGLIDLTASLAVI